MKRFTLLQLLKTNFFQHYDVPTSPQNFVQLSISSRFSLTINPTFVQQLFKTLLIILPHFQKDTLVTSKYQVQLKNQSTIK